MADVYDAEEADAKVREYAERLAAGAAIAQAAIKRCVYEGGQKTLDDGLALEAELMEQLFRSKDADEGLARVRREAQAGVRRRMTTVDHVRRLVHRRRAALERRRSARGRQPGRRAALRERGDGNRRRRRRGRKCSEQTPRSAGRASPCPSAARSSAAPRTTSRSTSTSWSRC